MTAHIPETVVAQMIILTAQISTKKELNFFLFLVRFGAVSGNSDL